MSPDPGRVARVVNARKRARKMTEASRHGGLVLMRNDRDEELWVDRDRFEAWLEGDDLKSALDEGLRAEYDLR